MERIVRHQLGKFELTIISGGRLWIDGGNMFGVVPKALWQRQCPPDDRNRIEMDTNCLLVKAEDSTILIDTGYGSKCSDRQCRNHALDSGDSLVGNLEKEGVDPSTIDCVILTHLHFDHAGGATRFDAEGHLVPVFPEARYIVQQHEWEDANADLPELAGAYFKNDFIPLKENGLLQLKQGDGEILPGIRVVQTRGHTRGHQIIYLESEGRTAVYLGDLCPLVGHLPAMWSMAYDQFPLETRQRKPQVLDEAVGKEWLIVFGHDAHIKSGYLGRDPKGNYFLKKSFPDDDQNQQRV